MGLRRQHASIGGALAFLLGNPVLNPATLIFMIFVLGWQFAVIRAVAGVALIAIAVAVAYRIAPESPTPTSDADFELAPIERSNRSAATLVVAWFRELLNELVAILPGYILVVLLLGAIRAWLFSPAVVQGTHGLGGTALVALVGTAFVIPTAAEIPIVQTLLGSGMGIAAAVALMITLPAISLPTLVIVRKVFPARVLWATFGIVVAVGIVAGLIASAIHL
ncbi:MAG: permease [Candidatus Eremiobacteraeota bacterium]|nr:permease [Candidatus Eremiobacteraeota bacterium]